MIVRQRELLELIMHTTVQQHTQKLAYLERANGSSNMSNSLT